MTADQAGTSFIAGAKPERSQQEVTIDGTISRTVFAPGFAILRIVAGLMFALHGSQKLLGWPPMQRAGGPLPTLLMVGGAIELVGGLMIAIGLFASYAAFIAAGEMAAAYFMAHAPHGWIPLLNKGELAVVYCFLWMYVAAHGAGIWSVEAARTGRVKAIREAVRIERKSRVA